jgi:predicted CoA-binding protein
VVTDHTRAILEKSATIAVVGLSTNEAKAAHAVPAFLQAIGYRVIPVHPSAVDILGEPAYRSVIDIGEPVDVVNVFRPAEEAPELARQAVAIGAKVLWLQQGIRSAEARQIAEEGGLQYVEGRCMGKLAAFYGITKARQVAST